MIFVCLFPVAPDKEYLLFCDESEASGRLYSNFYGGVLVGSSQYERVSRLLDAEKRRLNLFGKIKWSKVTLPYLEKYAALMVAFFGEIRAGHLDNARIRRARLSIQLENVVEVRSHDHVLAQCLDVVLGALAFHLNGRHRDLADTTGVRGNRTVAKEALVEIIQAQVRAIRPDFDAGVSTPTTKLSERWHAPYLRWSFTPAAPVATKGAGPT